MPSKEDKYTIWINRIYGTLATFGMLFLLMATSFVGGMAFNNYVSGGSKLVTITDLKAQLAHEEHYREYIAKLNQLQQKKPQ